MTPRYRIRFALPGPSAEWGAVRGMLTASSAHDVLMPNDIGHDTCGNFDVCWCEAVSAFEAGEITHLVTLHADVHPREDGWLDAMVEVAERRRASVVSVPVAIKDNREVVSCGYSDDEAGDSWMGQFVKIANLDDLPLDFDAADLGYPGRALLHNGGCILYDLRDERLRATNAAGSMVMCFNFPRRNVRGPDGRWRPEGNSEDFYTSRMMHKLGVPSVVTRRVRLLHGGRMLFPNWDLRKEMLARLAQEAAGALIQ